MKINKKNHEQIEIKHNTLKKFVLYSVFATFKEEEDKVNLVELAN